MMNIILFIGNLLLYGILLFIKINLFNSIFYNFIYIIMSIILTQFYIFVYILYKYLIELNKSLMFIVNKANFEFRENAENSVFLVEHTMIKSVDKMLKNDNYNRINEKNKIILNLVKRLKTLAIFQWQILNTATNVNAAYSKALAFIILRSFFMILNAMHSVAVLNKIFFAMLELFWSFITIAEVLIILYTCRHFEMVVSH